MLDSLVTSRGLDDVTNDVTGIARAHGDINVLSMDEVSNVLCERLIFREKKFDVEKSFRDKTWITEKPSTLGPRLGACISTIKAMMVTALCPFY